MKKNKLVWPSLVFFLAGIICTGTVLADWMKETKTVNTVSTGRLSGRIIQEYDGEEVPVLKPGEKTSHRVYVQNTGTEDCFARIRVETYWADQNGVRQDAQQFDPDDIQTVLNTEQDKSSWMGKKDEEGTLWFYYKGILAPGERTNNPVMESIGLHEDAGDLYDDSYGKIDIYMECIQITGGALEEMWNTEYEELGTEKPADKFQEGESKIAFKNPEEGFQYAVKEEGMFLSWDKALPGESFGQYVLLENEWEEAVSISMYGSFAQLDMNSREQELLHELFTKYITLKITDETRTILYEGNAWDDAFREGREQRIYLGTFQPGESRSAYVTLAVSPEIENEYQGLTGKLNWVFAAQGEETEDGDDLGKTALTPGGDSPETGDNSKVAMLLCCAVLCFAAMLFLLSKSRKSDK